MAASVYIIAEAGVNHNGERDKAFALVDAAAQAGADAVKFQTFNAKRLAALNAPKAAYQKLTTDMNESQFEMLKKLELPLGWHAELQSYAKSKGIEFLSTAFDEQSLSFLETLNLPLYKIPSGEITNGPLLWKFARTGKPLIVSTGMATLSEVEEALAVISHGLLNAATPSGLREVWRNWSKPIARQAVREKVTLLHCTSQYPTPVEEVNLAAMDSLGALFNLPVGYSDHTEGTLIPVAAVSRGAQIIEKHFTLSRNLPGPDHKASLEPDELARMVDEVRSIEVALGDSYKAPQPSEWDTRIAVRQQIVAARPIKAGQVLTADDLTTARAGSGKSAMLLWDTVGYVADRDLQAGESL